MDGSPTRSWLVALVLTLTAVPITASADDVRPGFTTREIAGWQVHVNEALLTNPESGLDAALGLLDKQLAEVVRVVPAPAVAELRKTPLWFSPEYPGVPPRAEFHPDAGWLRNNGRDPAMARAVEFTNVRIFAAETDRMPNFVLHELAHAYHFRVLGRDRADVIAAYERAKAANLYGRVERHHGNGRPNTFEAAYAMTDPAEYFAETTEAYFSRNDFFPFTREELRAHDPRMFAVLEDAWGVKPAPAPAPREAAAAPAPEAALADYGRMIKPLLAARCGACHGALKQESGLRLDTAASLRAGGESGPALVPGDAAASLILARVSDPDPATRMPPEGEAEPLGSAEVAALAAWISAGAPAPSDEQPDLDPRQHWAFQPRLRPEVPPVSLPAWQGRVRNPIDAFLARDHERHGLLPQAEAPRHVLVRRLYLDLIGLPPTPEDLAALVADDAPDWYERLVDRLLADPRHGERWGRHWMDIWRYSDWWGLGDEHRNSQKHIWHFRDWIIESLNADVPYDEMLRQMLAADEFYPDDPSRLRATGFLARNWFSWNRTQWLDETVEHVGKGLLGLTLNCSKCHDHKYDPIRQQDFYAMRAFFEPHHVRLDVVPGEPDVTRDGIPRVFDAWPDAPTYLFVRGEEAKADTSRSIPPGVPEALEFCALTIEPVPLPKAAWQPARQPWVIETHLAAARRALADAQQALEKPATDATTRRHDVDVAAAELRAVEQRADATRAAWTAEDDPTAADAARSAADRAAAAVRAEREVAVAKARRALAAAEGRQAQAAASGKPGDGKDLQAARDALAKAEQAAAEPDGPFTPFVGTKWSATRFRGSAGEDPAPPFLATSTGRRRALATWITDPKNPLTARVAVNHVWMRHLGRPLVTTTFDFGRKGNAPANPALLDWLASELVEGGPGSRPWAMKHLHRLIVTSAAYRMSSSTRSSGANVRIDPDNRLLWRRDAIRLEAEVIRDCMLALAGTLDPAMGGPPVPAGEQPQSLRRSLYFFHSSVDRNALLKTFDAADVKECYERDRSIVPQQALALANAALVHDAAGRIATRLGGGDDMTFVERAFLAVLGRGPDDAERAACAEALEAWRTLGRDGVPAVDDPARALVAWALLNHNDFVTVR